MGSYCLYGINFFDEAIESLERYFKKYPADKNLAYAHYLVAVIYFEQITDEKKDIEPLLKTNKKIDFFLKNFPDNEYAIDLKFKKDLMLPPSPINVSTFDCFFNHLLSLFHSSASSLPNIDLTAPS